MAEYEIIIRIFEVIVLFGLGFWIGKKSEESPVSIMPSFESTRVRELAHENDELELKYSKVLAENVKLEGLYSQAQRERVAFKTEAQNQTDRAKAIEKEYETYRKAQNDKIDELYNRVVTMMTKKDKEHNKDLECADCYWRTKASMDRKDYMQVISVKDELIRQLRSEIASYKKE